MAGQEPAQAKVFPLQAFLAAWLQEGDPEAEPAPEVAETDRVSDAEVDEPEGVEQLAQFPKVLATLRGAEMITLQEEECTREILVPWVSASLAMPWSGSETFSPGGFSAALQKLEGELGNMASPGVARLRRYAMLDAIGDTLTERGETVRRLYVLRRGGAGRIEERGRREEAEG